jgi:uncharacterized protein
MHPVRKWNFFINLAVILGLAWPCALFGQLEVRPVVADYLYPAQSASLDGYLGGRLGSARQKRILGQDVDRLVAPFRDRSEDHCWQTEFWGKWVTSAVLAYRYLPDAQLKAKLDYAVTELLATQSQDGYIGNYADEKQLQQWDIWGQKYCLLGILAYYQLTRSSQSLQAARRLADHLIKEVNASGKSIVTMGNHRGMAASSVLQPLVLLYEYTNDSAYLQFANQIVRAWESPLGPQLISKSSVDVARRFPRPSARDWFGWQQGQKAYEMMSCYEGLLELYRVTGKEAYRRAVENTWENIRRTEINIAGSGSAMECWFGGKSLQEQPVKHYQETCVTVTWIKLSLELLRLTGEAKYADAIEEAYYNALLGALKLDGSDWAKYSPLAGVRLEGSSQCNMGINCCEASGPRALFALPLHMVMQQKEGLSINFFSDGDFRLATPSGQLMDVFQQTSYPESGTVAVTLRMQKPELMTLRIRIPSWSKSTKLLVNGEPVQVQAGSYIILKRSWKNQDQIQLSLDMQGRLLKAGEQSQYLAVMRGPLVLARDSRLGGPDVNTPLVPLPNKAGYIELEPVASADKAIWQQYKASFLVESHGEGEPQALSIFLCDYLSAGNTFDSNTQFRVWLPGLIDPENMR